jgi:dihydroxy-acid dehydratase
VTKLNRRFQLITAGVARSPDRVMLRAVGFKDGDFEKAIVGVANGHSTMNPSMNPCCMACR